MQKPQETEPDYKQMYLELYRAQMRAMQIMVDAHRKAEDLYITAGEEDRENSTKA